MNREATPARLLVVDDDAAASQTLLEVIRTAGLAVDAVASAEEALEKFRDETYAVVIADLQLPGESGLDLVKRLRREAPATAVVVMTGHASVQSAVAALKLGAADYLVKPANPAQLRKLVEKLASERPSHLPNALLSAEAPGDEVFEGMLARSAVMHRVFERVQLVAKTDATVLIMGETGTGKELVARAVHNRSPRAQGPFVPVHTGALPKELIESELFGHEKGAFTGAVGSSEGKFGAAKGGTIFLDEISTMPERAQVDLLRVLETFKYTRVGGKSEHTADVRVVCATNTELLEMVSDGKFREDLYYRISIFPLQLPPLRHRKEDLGLLSDRFLRAAALRYQREMRPLPGPTEQVLHDYDWPGNVRELRNLIEQAVLLAQGDVIEPELMKILLTERPRRVTPAMVPIAVGTSMVEAERMLARRTLAALGGNREQAASALGIGLDRLADLLQEESQPAQG
jgi:DNA-binding NtrC family response regulator